MDVSEARRLKSLEEENARLKRLLKDAMLDNAALKDILGKKPRRPPLNGRAPLDDPLPDDPRRRRVAGAAAGARGGASAIRLPAP